MARRGDLRATRARRVKTYVCRARCARLGKSPRFRAGRAPARALPRRAHGTVPYTEARRRASGFPRRITIHNKEYSPALRSYVHHQVFAPCASWPATLPSCLAPRGLTAWPTSVGTSLRPLSDHSGLPLALFMPRSGFLYVCARPVHKRAAGHAISRTGNPRRRRGRRRFPSGL